MAIRAAFVLAALVLATSAHAQSVCVLPMDIKGSANIGGTIKEPVEAPLNGGGTGFTGKVHLVFPQGSCPTKDNVKDALKNAYLATPFGAQGVTIGDSTATVGTDKSNPLATVTISNLKATVTSKPNLQSPVVTATDGVVKTKAIIQVDDVNMKGQQMPANGNACSPPTASGNGISISCKNMQLTNNYKTSSGAAELKLNGSLDAYGDLSNAKLVSASSVPKP